MTGPVQYSVNASVATVAMDDGKANVFSPAMLRAIGDGLDRAEKDDVVGVVLAGRAGRFSGGFDLKVLTAGGPDATEMLRGGFELAERLLGFPRPVVVACTGHAIAMGSFLLCAADYRVGADGAFRIQANEVAIGLTMPYSAIALLRYRLTPPAFDRAVNISAAFAPADAVVAGWLDETVAPEAVVARAQEVAASFASLDGAAHHASKLRARAAVLAGVRRGIDSGDRE